MKSRFLAMIILYTAILSVVSNCFFAVSENLYLLFAIIPAFVLVNIFAGTTIRTSQKRLKICFHGTVVLVSFLVSSLASVAYHIFLLTIPNVELNQWFWSALTAFCIEALLFWNGIICVYFTSVQLGIKIRVVGALCGMIPVVNLWALGWIIKTVYKEIEFEIYREKLDDSRRDEQVCRTKYPILFVHGVFFRDSRFINYWGRIPKALEQNGAKIYYGEHQSAASVEDSARELAKRIERLVEDTGCEKLNIIAHSKGGLDCRYAISKLGAYKYVASLTTVNTPHRGCKFADYLLGVLPDRLVKKIADTYNSALRKLGDDNPDFIAAVNDLTAEKCIFRDKEMGLPQGIFCRSIGSKLNKARNGKFPLNFTYHLARYFDGANDGLVGEDSFRWGDNYVFLHTEGKRGISHGDMVDLNRENLDGFDVREFYIDIVNNLKKQGL